MSAGQGEPDLPHPDLLNEHLNRVEQISMRLRSLSAYQSVVPTFRQPNYVKHEEDTRMHDIVPTSTRHPFVEPYPPPPPLHPMYPETSPSEEQYWGQGHEHGRSKYKKRSVVCISLVSG
jgi:hypothetical protein